MSSLRQSARNVRVEERFAERRTYLRAECLNNDGVYVDCSLNLDAHIGNHSGALKWGGQNFTQSCMGIFGGWNGDQFCLYANPEPRPQDGAKVLFLTSHIVNDNGRLVPR